MQGGRAVPRHLADEDERAEGLKATRLVQQAVLPLKAKILSVERESRAN